MTLLDDMLPVAFDARSIAGSLGFRPHTVALLRRITSGTARNVIGEEETPVTESGGQPPKVRWLKEEELAVGGLAKGTIEVGPITPAFSGGGTDIATLHGRDLSAGDHGLLRIRGPMCPGTDGALYRITRLQADRALRYMLQAEPLEPSPKY